MVRRVPMTGTLRVPELYLHSNLLAAVLEFRPEPWFVFCILWSS